MTGVQTCALPICQHRVTAHEPVVLVGDPGKDLLRACLGEVAARIDFSPDPDDWRRNARNQADALWALLEAHPGLDRVLIGVPWAVEYFADTIGSAYRAFTSAGMSEEDAALAVDVIGDTVVSSHAEVAALRANWTSGTEPRTGFGRLPAPFHLDPAWLERGWLDRKKIGRAHV